MTETPMRVAVVGRNAGVDGPLWAGRGHRVYAADSDDAHIAAARQRSREAGLGIVYELAHAGALPWPDRSMDLCIVPELIGRAADWRACLSECVRVLRPGGALHLGTTDLGWLARRRLRRQLAPHGLTRLERSSVADAVPRAILTAIKRAS